LSLPPTVRLANQPANRPISTRPLSLLSPHRPQLPSPTTTPAPASPAAAVTAPDGAPLDLLPKLSTHPAVLATQVRCGPRNTFDPSHRVRKRRHGFLARLKSRTGRAVLKRRRLKGRWSLTH
ncbi:hypothetical protein AOQ84DRAFT_296428, partial [Glonium stellatum]